MPSRRVRVVLGWQRQHAPRVCAAFVGELHAVCIRGTPTLPALELLPSEKRNLTDDEKRPHSSESWAGVSVDISAVIECNTGDEVAIFSTRIGLTTQSVLAPKKHCMFRIESLN